MLVDFLWENKMRDDSKTIDFYNDILEMDTNFIEASEKRLKMVIDLKGPDFKTVPSCFSGISQNYFRQQSNETQKFLNLLQLLSSNIFHLPN